MTNSEILAEVITIGDELLIGQIVNTNSAWICSRLNEAGIQVNHCSTIGDDDEDIKKALDRSLDSSDVIILTGGLGPTSDDKTRDTLCEYFGDELVLNESVLSDINDFFSSLGREVTERNVDQARVPAKSIAIRNKLGTAPGMWFDLQDKIVVSLPGVPYEMKAQMEGFVLPELNRKFSRQGIIHKTITTIGLGESVVADRLVDAETALPEYIKIAYLPSPGIVRIRLSCYERVENVEAEMESVAETICQAMKKYVVTTEDQTLEEYLASILMQKQACISVAESCTGGNIAKKLTSVPGCSAWFNGGVVAYTNDVKHSQLSVPKELILEYGVVSGEVAEAMAMGAKKALNSDWAISTTGIAGPDGGNEKNPVGTVWVGISGPEGEYSRRFRFHGDRTRNIDLATLFAINELRLKLT